MTAYSQEWDVCGVGMGKYWWITEEYAVVSEMNKSVLKFPLVVVAHVCEYAKSLMCAL